MKTRTLISLVVISAILSVKLFAQKDHTLEANKAFESLQYSYAVDLYKKAYAKTKEKDKKAEIIFKTAECYRLMNDFRQTELWYNKCIKIRYPNPIIYLHYADALKAQGKYDEALVQYNIYKEKRPDDKRGEIGAQSCELSQKWKDNPTRYVVKNEVQLNTKFDDFAPSYADKQCKSLIFTSNREGCVGKSPDEWTGLPFTDLFFTKVDKKGKWSTPTPLGESINTDANEGASQLDPKKNTMYFTRCKSVKKEKMGCNLYMATKKGQDFADPEPLPIPKLTDSSIAGHPSVSEDELSLYFSANLPGGYGGKDIWVTVRKRNKDQWLREPVNLGPNINTPGDEVFPFIHPDGTLYFSSNGHIGMGGWDIFKAKKTGEDPTKFGPPANLRYPINSEGDDFGIIFEPKYEKGFFSSNRAGGKGMDDIYSFLLPPLELTLQGVVRDKKTKAILPNSFVKLSGTDGSSAETKTDASGMYRFDKTQILPNTSYVLVVGHLDAKGEQDYLQTSGKTTTVGLEVNTDLVLDFELDPIDKPIRLPEIRFELNKWDLLPQYQDSLLGLIKTLNENPNIVIQLRSHTDCRATDQYNITLSQKRSESVVNFLIERGIEPERMIAKGMGETEPRTVDIPGTSFEMGTVLTERFIEKLPSEELKEEAHQLNRRSDFKVIRKDYVPKQKPPGSGSPGPNIEDIKPE